MASKSTIVTEQQLNDMRKHIETLKEARKEIELADRAGIQLNYTTKQIDEQIAALELIIRNYTL